MKRVKIFFTTLACLVGYVAIAQSPLADSLIYRQMQRQMARGWNTWNTHSLLSHVWLPEGLTINLWFKSGGLTPNRYLHESYFHAGQPRPEKMTAGYHAYDGSYTELFLQWEGLEARVETASEGTSLYILVTPIKLPKITPYFAVEAGMIWNRPGFTQRKGNQLEAKAGKNTWIIAATAPTVIDFLPLTAPYLSFRLGEPIGISVSNLPKTLPEIKQVIAQKRIAFEKSLDKYGEDKETYLAIQSVLAWNVIYDPERQAVFAPVSRHWNTTFGGHYVLFDWDTYLSALMAARDYKQLAYAQVVEVSLSIDDWGMVPNYRAAHGLGSPDRSQPPVGALVVYELYKQYKDTWLISLLFDRLLRWNRWWIKHRHKVVGDVSYLCWGSDNLPPDEAAHSWQGAAYESGMDNSPMFDGVPFNKQTNLMEQADVGLISLYVADCQALAAMANILHRPQEERELMERAAVFSKALQTLWNDHEGIFLNRRTDTGKWNYRLSPTLFYPLIGKVATQEQAERMVKEHLLNPETFAGKWMLPSVPQNDPAFTEQSYWRGRIWAPLHALVYIGLRNYHLAEARQRLTQNANELLLKNWRESRSVYENYHAINGDGTPCARNCFGGGDRFYHWGGLLGHIYLWEKGK